MRGIDDMSRGRAREGKCTGDRWVNQLKFLGKVWIGWSSPTVSTPFPSPFASVIKKRISLGARWEGEPEPLNPKIVHLTSRALMTDVLSHPLILSRVISAAPATLDTGRSLV